MSFRFNKIKAISYVLLTGEHLFAGTPKDTHKLDDRRRRRSFISLILRSNVAFIRPQFDLICKLQGRSDNSFLNGISYRWGIVFTEPVDICLLQHFKSRRKFLALFYLNKVLFNQGYLKTLVTDATWSLFTLAFRIFKKFLFRNDRCYRHGLY